MTAMLPPPSLVVRTESEVLDAIPTLLGFEPDDSVVVLLATPRDGVILTARVDLDVCVRIGDPTEPLQAALRRIGWRSDLGAIVVGYGDDHRVLCEVVRRMLDHLPAVEIFGAVVVGTTWWFHDDGPADPGRPYDPRSSAIGAAAVYAGQQVLGSRAEVAATLDPPSGRRPAGVTTAFASARQRAGELPYVELQPAMDAALDAAWTAVHHVPRASADALTLADVAWLAALARIPAAREAYWQRLDRTTGRGFVQVWREVVRAAPRRDSVAPLCLLGMAAWQAGDGVVMTICLERATAVSSRHDLVQILGGISAGMLPPSLWTRMRSDAPDEVA